MTTKYDLLKVLRAVEACYVCDYNPINMDKFIQLFCERYNLDVEKEHRRIRSILHQLAKQEKIIIKDDEIYMENMLRSNIRLYISG